MLGEKTGRGRFDDGQGSWYEGDFVDGAFHGMGKYQFAYNQPKTYTGQFANNNMNGKGVMVWDEQGDSVYTRYEGDYVDGKMQGHGTLFYRNGDKYIGEFSNDNKEGSGIFYDITSQQKRMGTWKNDKRVAWTGNPLPYSIHKHLTT